VSDFENINHLWQWQSNQESSYLTCSLLSNWQHGFFTKQFYPRLPEELTLILQPSTTAFRVKQVHGNTILTPQEIITLIKSGSLINSIPDADAVISDLPGQSVWAASADCTPILIGNIQTGQVCAIHAGWRGTAKRIVVEAVTKFIKFGSQKEDLRIAIGPAIAGEAYQVDDYVAVDVGKTISTLAETEVINALKKLSEPPILEDELPAKVRLDVPQINFLQLTQLGINPAHIAIAPYCTYEQNDLFFSYRRTGEKKVQWSGILSN